MSSWGKLIWVRFAVTEIGWDSRIRRRVPDTWCLTGASSWENLIGQLLAFPPPYRAPGSPVRIIHANDRAVVMGEQNLTGPLRDLVTAILAQ